MKRGIFIAIIFLLPVLAVASNGVDKDISTQANLKAFLSTGRYSAKSVKAFDSFLNKLDGKRASLKSEQAFVNYIFSKAHNRFLKNYVAYTSLDETFDKGSYNCLTGTILFSLILNHYAIRHEVIETNYHIFILAETKEGQVLLETTDPVNGFVTSPKEIEDRIRLYKQNEIQTAQPGKSYYKFRFELFNSLTMDELRGLVHYNMAVNSFNQQDLRQAVTHFVNAQKLYSSARIEEFSQVLLLSLQQSELDQKTKENCMNTILSVRQKSLPVIIASNN